MPERARTMPASPRAPAYEVKPVTPALIGDVGALFGTDRTAQGCWCVWFVIPVKDYHAAGPEGNRARFCELANREKEPVGLLAYRDGEPVGWCAVGPRTRYARALRTPTFKGHDPAEDASVWLVPCFFVRRDARRENVCRALLTSAVAFAREHGAAAIEGFPLAGTARRSGTDVQVGFEPLFASCGFVVTRRPSPNRVVMRRELAV